MNHTDHKSNGKIRVAILYGGRSSEHEVSLNSATNVIMNLDRDRFEVVPIGIARDGSWFLGEDITKQLEGDRRLQLQEDAKRMLFTPGLIGKHPDLQQASELIARAKNKERLFDVVFPVIHGPLCEDGTIQGLLELAEVPYVGCGVLSSAVGMDKDVSKRLAMNAGIRVPSFLVIKQGQWNKNAQRFCDMVEEQLTYPVFVKPANTGSSVGVFKVKSRAELKTKMEEAFQFDTKVIVEQGIDAMELEISVLESLDYGADPIVSVVGEIRPQNGHEFYSYASKYLDENGAAIIIPAAIPDDVQERAKEVAKTIFAALECEGMSRVDLFLERNTDRIYFNEVNTIPGFTQISMYPKLLEASGVSYTNLLTHLIDLALDRHARRSQLIREYVES